MDFRQLENAIREKLSQWIPSFNKKEMEEDWEAVMQKMQNSTPETGKKSGFSPGGLIIPGVVVFALVSAYLIYNATQKNEIQTADDLPQTEIATDALPDASNQLPEDILSHPLPQLQTSGDVSPADEIIRALPDVGISTENEENTKPDIDREKAEDLQKDINSQPEDEVRTQFENLIPAGTGGNQDPATGTASDDSDASQTGVSGYTSGRTIEKKDRIHCNPNPGNVTYESAGRYLEPGEYQISEIRKDNGRIDTILRTMIVPETVQADFDVDEFSPPHVSFRNRSQHADVYIWNFGNGRQTYEEHPEYSYADTGRYQVKLIAENSYGCRDTAYHSLSIYPEWVLRIPNIFTPNNTGVNDEFYITIEGEQYFNLRIYDRDNRTVFTTNEKVDMERSKAWDGTFRSTDKECPTGIYFYILEYKKLGDDKVHRESGSITLQR